MFNSILVPLDGSLLAECVLPHTIAIARSFDAEITLLRMLEKNQESTSKQSFDLLNWQIIKKNAALYLEKTKAQFQASGLRARTTILEGFASEGIAEYAQNQGMKLIILSSHGHSGLTQWGISDITQRIIFNVSTSVLIVRAHQMASSELIEEQYQRIMVPLDGSRRAEVILPIVTLLARFYKSQIHIVHVVKTPEMARRMPLVQEDIELSNRIVARNREEATTYLDQMLSHSPLAGVNVKTHLLTSDNPAATLHELANREHIDMVAISAHGYSGDNRWPYGSMVNNFILYSQVPLLIVQDLPPKEENI